MSRILIAEDDKEISGMLCEFLSTQGYETVSAGNGLEALRIVREDSEE